MDSSSEVVRQFKELWRDVERSTYGTVVLADCEPEYSRVLSFVRAHPQAQAELATVFANRPSDYVTRFCMRHLQWPEVAEAARKRMAEDIHNSEYETLQRLLSVYNE